MHAHSDSPRHDVAPPLSVALQVPLMHFHVNQMLALAQWTATLWLFGQNQLSRYSTYLRGGVPLDA